MNKFSLLSLVILLLSTVVYADNNRSKEDNSTNDTNLTKAQRIQKQVKEQMELEKKYAKEQSFAQGDDYDLKAVEVDASSLDSIPVIEPEYDFDMTDVYRDDL